MLILINQISRSIDLFDSYRNHKVTFAESQHVQFKKIVDLFLKVMKCRIFKIARAIRAHMVE